MVIWALEFTDLMMLHEVIDIDIGDFVGVLNLTMDTRHIPSLAQVFEGPIYNHPFKVYFTKKTHFTEYFKIIKTSEVHMPYIPPENVKLVTKPWPYAKKTQFTCNVANRNWRVEGHHFYHPVRIGGQVKSLLSQSLDKVFNHYQFTETINEEPKASTTENLGSVEYIYDILTYTNNKPPYYKVIFQVIWTVKFDEQEISKDLTKDSKGLLPLINGKYILKKHPDLGKVWALLVDEKLSIPRNLVTERKYPYDQIPLSMDARLLWVAEPRLSVNRMISGTRTYTRTLLNGSHSMLPYSFTRTTVPMVYLCRATLDNWTIYCYDSIIHQHNSTDHNADLYLRYCIGKATSNYWEMVREERERDRLEKERANCDTKEVKR